MAGRQRNNSHYDQGDNMDSSQGSIKIRRKGNSLHPSHLTGREIGLYYAKRGKNRRKRQMQHIVIDEQTKMSIALVIVKHRSLHSNFKTPSMTFKRQYQEMLHENMTASSLSGLAYKCEISRDRCLDERLKKRLEEPQTDTSLKEFKEKLPAFKLKDEIVSTLKKHKVMVISGETGCGKTTQVGQYILDDYIQRGDGSLCNIACTQPRRISAISVAERVAVERNDTCGGPNSTVGYVIRLDQKNAASQGAITFCTPGILLQYLQHDRSLQNYSHIILDEVHERDLQTDFLIIILRDLMKYRSDLHVVLMSATLNAERFAQYFGHCPMVHIPGFTYPVTEFYLEDVIEHTRYFPRHVNVPQLNFKFTRRGQRELRKAVKDTMELDQLLERLGGRYSNRTLEVLSKIKLDHVQDMFCDLIKYICNTSSADCGILVFLTGWVEIKNLHNELAEDPFFESDKFLVIPLHSMMPTINQCEVFNRPPSGVRKIVLATNIAETSITINDIVYVVDGGKIKMSNFDENTNLATLLPEWVSVANAKQRKGRAGRVQAGICYHLFTSDQLTRLQDYQLPQMLRTRLEDVCLRIKILKLGSIENFLMKAMDPPSFRSISLSKQLLHRLQALDKNEQLTPLGFHLAKLPVHPQIGKMILLSSIFSCIDPVLTVAASLSFKAPFSVPLGKEQIADKRKAEFAENSFSDHIVLINAIKRWEKAEQEGHGQQFAYHYFLSIPIIKMILDMKVQLAGYLMDLKFLYTRDLKNPDFNENSDNYELVKAIICAGLYPNVIKCKNFGQRSVTLASHRNPQSRFSRKRPTMKTESENVVLHPQSVNVEERYYSSPWLVYHLKVKSTSVFIHDCTMVTPFQLLFFGGTINVDRDEDTEYVTVDRWIKFKCSHATANMVKDLRMTLDTFLAYRIQNPGVTLWNSSEDYFDILSSIVHLVTCKDSIKNLQDLDGMDDESFFNDQPGPSQAQ